VERFRKSLHAAIYYESCCFSTAPDAEIRKKKSRKDDDRFIIINAMNEWAEGMVLEPSTTYGRHFLEVIQETKRSIQEQGC